MPGTENIGKKRILLLGLGNDILGDDAVGLIAARELRVRMGDEIDIIEASIAGFALLDLFRSYDKVLVVDSVSTGKSVPGWILELSPEHFQQQASFSPHYVGLHDVIEMAKKLGFALPSEIRILAIEVSDPFVLREGLSAEISGRVPQLVEAAASILQGWTAQVSNIHPATD